MVEALRVGEALRTLCHRLQRQVVVVEGRLLRNEKAYRNGYYHTLREGEERLTVQLRPELDARLPREGEVLVRLRGFLDCKVGRDRLEPILHVSEVLGLEEAPPEDPRLGLYRAIACKDRKDVPALLRRKLLAGQAPRLLFLYAREGVVDEDLERALGPGLARYACVEERLPFTPEALARRLRQADAEGYDAIAVVRGGGSGLEALDHPGLVEAALSLRTPLVVAAGHAKDETLLARAADWRVETPSLLGTRLKELLAGDGPVEVRVEVPVVPPALLRSLRLWQGATVVLLLLVILLFFWR